MTRKLISVVVAVYRNEGAVTATHRKIQELFATDLPAYDYEVIFVNDGSDDGSFDEIMGLREKDPCVKVISFTRNFGQMSAMLAGFKQARGAAVINISADLQDPIELIAQMVAEWEGGAQTVICHRTSRKDGVSTRLTSKLAYRLLRMAVKDIPAGGFDYVLMDRRVMDEFNSVEVRNRFFQGDLLWLGFRTSLIPYERQERRIGRSQYDLLKRLTNFTDALLDSSYLPIRFMSLLGLLTTAGGFLYFLTVVVAWFFDFTPSPGWAPIITIILVVGGVIMTMLGVIGEYQWRIYHEVRKKPNYIIQEEHL